MMAFLRSGEENKGPALSQYEFAPLYPVGLICFQALSNVPGKQAGPHPVMPPDRNSAPAPGRGRAPESGRGRALEPGRGLALVPGRGRAIVPGRGRAIVPGRGRALESGRGRAIVPGRGLAPVPGRGLALVPGRYLRVTGGMARRPLDQTGNGFLARAGVQDLPTMELDVASLVDTGLDLHANNEPFSIWVHGQEARVPLPLQ